MDLENKMDFMLQKFDNFEKKFDKLETKVDNLEKKFDKLETKVDNLENKFDKLDKKVSYHDKRFDRLEAKLTRIDADNKEEHAHMMELLTSLNSAFIKYETDGLDKIRILFDADDDRRNHQDIYGHEFHKLNDLVAKNSFRISNLEKHFN